MIDRRLEPRHAASERDDGAVHLTPRVTVNGALVDYTGWPLMESPAIAMDDRVLHIGSAADEEAQWSAVGAKVRNQTRKATREGLELGRSTLEAFDRAATDSDVGAEGRE